MQSNFNEPPDIDAITRNLVALDLAHLSPEESIQYEHELSVLAALNEALEAAEIALKTADPLDFWQQLHLRLSDTAALVGSQIAPLLSLNAERSFELSDPPAPKPLALTVRGSSR